MRLTSITKQCDREHCDPELRQRSRHKDTPYGFFKRVTAVTVSALLSAFVLAACAAESAPPLPTRTPAPTFTPQLEIVQEAPAAQNPDSVNLTEEGDLPTPTELPQAEPTATNTPEPSPTPLPAAEVVINTNMNVRGGPGTNYNILGTATSGSRYPVTGKNDAGTWWQVDYNGQDGWVFGDLVTAENTGSVAVAQNIPAPPPTPVPQPVVQQPAPQPEPQQPAPQPEPQQPAPQPADNYPYVLIDDFVRCNPNEATTYFQGYVRDRNNNLKNAVCLHIEFYEPRNTKCSGCDGVGDGNWGFSPFGGPAPPGTTVSIFVVQCPGPMPEGGQTQATGFGDLTPQSPKWTRTIQQSEQCTEITFAEK